MKPIEVSAPGKLHILGEHAVVYGKPAIIAAVNKRCTVKLTLRRDDRIKINSIDTSSFRHSGNQAKPEHPESPMAVRDAGQVRLAAVLGEPRLRREALAKRASMTGEQILKQTQKARKAWERYRKTSDIELLKAITKHPLDYIVIAIGEALMYYDKNFAGGFNLEIHSEIPTGAGLGSSAAIAVAVTGAVTLFLNKEFNKDTINKIAYLTEQKKHGFPSGGDNSASCFGGLIWYRKETPDLKIIKPIPFSFPQRLANNFVAINTGIPVESTGEMVSIVRNLYKGKPEFVESILSSQEKLTRKILSAIKNDDETLMIYIIKVGEKNLESLGVVSKSTKLLIRQIEEKGGAAKICGGGGRKLESGVVLAYHKKPELLNDIAKHYSFSFEPIVLGAEGVREEII